MLYKVPEDVQRISDANSVGSQPISAVPAHCGRSDEASFITGTELVIDGGFLAQ
jgi:hypothetical protein